MRFCVLCVYWTLLLVSVISSGLLFLIVASEGTQISEKPEGVDRENNIPLKDVGKESGDDYPQNLDNEESDVRSKSAVNMENENIPEPERSAESSEDEYPRRETERENNLNVIKQSLTPQPNLSQGISETGQAVVLTLVDTTAAELQSFAEPRLSSDPRLRSLFKNTTLRTTTTGPVPSSTVTSSTTSKSLEHDKLEEQSSKGTSGSLPSVPLAPGSSSNVTKVGPIESDKTTDKKSEDAPDQKDEVVVVRAEQKTVEDTTTRKVETVQEEEIKEDIVKEKENVTTSPELDDGEVRAKLVTGSSEESAAVLLDGLVPSGSTENHEEIPSFSEWAQKRLEEAEKKKTHPNASIQNPGGPGRGLGGMKVRSKNYASPDCGAKIIAVNPEARSARSVLVSTRDEYMLNTCTSRIWFVVELCEAIQAKKIELANFELFSSSPKDFSVYVSDRFPTRDWSPVGQFTAKDHRDIQSFALHPHLFGKFIKVELHSHHGSEHFCPISMFRSYGTSEFEVLETETDHQESVDENSNEDDDDEDETLDSESGAETRNLFGSARDAVLRIVKKAAEVLVKTGDPSNNNNITKIQESIEDGIIGNSFESCMTPRYTINCVNCTDKRFADVFKLLNCRSKLLDDILSIPFVNETLRTGELCSFYGLNATDSKQKRDVDSIIEETSKRKFLHRRNSRVAFLASIYSPEYILALCNVIAAKERRFVLNTSYELSGNPSLNSSTRIDADVPNFEPIEANGKSRITAPVCSQESDSNACKDTGTSKEAKISKIQGVSLPEQESSISKSVESSTITTTATTTNGESLASQIKPTKALNREDVKKEASVPIPEPSKDPKEDNLHPEVLTTSPPMLNTVTATTKITEEPVTLQSPVESTPQLDTTDMVTPNLVTREAPEPAVVHDNSHENTAPSKMENNDQDMKLSKSENGEQEAKLMAQDQISLDSILSDLKDFEADGTNIQGNVNHNANIAAQPTASTTPQQKESVFLRLSNRIKALERNMSLSGQYLEELSKRYKKQVEEMQRSLERATAAMIEESRKGEERELRRLEEISALRHEITSLSQSMEILLYDRDSWRSKLSMICQHFALVVVEIIVFVIVVSYCRRNSEFEDVDDNTGSIENEVTRRRSAGAMSSCGGTKKSKKRRPSEIATRIGGTYGDLMIDERSTQETKKEKKKRRKRESNGRSVVTNETRKDGTSLEDNIPGGTTLPSRRSSSTDPSSCHAKQLELCHTRKRPDSAPEYTGIWIDQSAIKKSVDENVERLVDSISTESNDRQSPIEETSGERVPLDDRKNNEPEKNTGVSLFRVGGGGSILKVAKLSSPSFMKTALNSRSKRNAKTIEKNESNAQLRSDNWEWYSRNSGTGSGSGSPTSLRIDLDSIGNGEDILDTNKNGRHRNIGNESESSGSTTTTATKKDKKTGGGLRKMVRKFF